MLTLRLSVHRVCLGLDKAQAWVLPVHKGQNLHLPRIALAFSFPICCACRNSCNICMPKHSASPDLINAYQNYYNNHLLNILYISHSTRSLMEMRKSNYFPRICSDRTTVLDILHHLHLARTLRCVLLLSSVFWEQELKHREKFHL